MVIFVTAAAVLLVAVALAVWTVSSERMVALQEEGGVRQAQASAALVQRLLVPGRGDLRRQTQEISTLSASGALVTRDGTVLAAAGLVPEQVPPRLKQLVESGTPARQRVRIDGEVRLVVGIPLARADASYYQSLPLRELDSALRTISTTLSAAVGAGVLLAGLLGSAATRRALRPVDELTAAADAVARGQLATRMPADDPDLARLADVFNGTTAALERRVRSDARFVSNVSHELRTPLTTMANALAVLERRRAQLPEVAREAVDLLGSQVTRLEQLVLDLLEISVVTEGVPGAALHPVDLPALVRQLATTEGWEPVEVHAEPLTVLGVPRRLERIVINLVTNAQEHGGGLVRLTVLRRGDRVRVEVDDRGPGVPEEARERIFERFQRGSVSADQSPGAGIGLALVAELTALHRGDVWVEDRPGGGARFVLELPEIRP